MQAPIAAAGRLQTKQRIDGIQVLRAIAALLVVFGHSVEVLESRGQTPFISIHLSRFFSTFGVFLFFMISGFIMITSSIGLYDKPRGPQTFLARRICRIVPLYWIVTLVYVAKLAVVGEMPDVSGVLQSLFFIPYNGTRPDMHPIFGVGWTLNYEMEFYVLFALSLFFSTQRGLALLFAALGSLAVCGTIIAGGYLPRRLTRWNTGPTRSSCCSRAA